MKEVGAEWRTTSSGVAKLTKLNEVLVFTLSVGLLLVFSVKVTLQTISRYSLMIFHQCSDRVRQPLNGRKQS
jgi:hypothetical protein